MSHLSDLIDLTPITPTPAMADPGPVPDTEDQGPVDPERLERLAQYLLLHPAGAEPEFIAVAFGWTIGEVHAARAVLNAAIEHVGITIVHANDRCYLTTTSRDRSTPTRDASTIAALATQNRPVTAGEARMLTHALNNTWPNVIRDGEKPALAHVVNLGLLTPNDGGEHQPSPALLDAFID